ncbi:hypothetical protein [Streptomyces sp. IBSBF 2806]|uniref:hypothetical protein n=1 Tax=Streptomyces sp. IBSBF 2806 TaxID=2903529 RepID=UPI002FDBF82C
MAVGQALRGARADDDVAGEVGLGGVQGDHFVQMRWDDEGGAGSPAGDLEVELGAEGFVQAGEDLVFGAAVELVQEGVDFLAVGQVVGDGEPDQG